MPTLKQYDAELDANCRIKIQDAKSKSFLVTHDQNGNIILQPRRNGGVKRLAVISVRTLRMMDRSMRNFANRKVSAPADLRD